MLDRGRDGRKGDDFESLKSCGRCALPLGQAPLVHLGREKVVQGSRGTSSREEVQELRCRCLHDCERLCQWARRGSEDADSPIWVLESSARRASQAFPILRDSSQSTRASWSDSKVC